MVIARLKNPLFIIAFIVILLSWILYFTDKVLILTASLISMSMVLTLLSTFFIKKEK
jgi:hypothetical protein